MTITSTTEAAETAMQRAISEAVASDRALTRTEAARANGFMEKTKAELAESIETMLNIAVPSRWTKVAMAKALAKGLSAMPKASGAVATNERYREYLGTLLQGFEPVGLLIERLEAGRRARGVTTRIDERYFTEVFLPEKAHPKFEGNWALSEIGSPYSHRVWLDDDSEQILQGMQLPGVLAIVWLDRRGTNLKGHPEYRAVSYRTFASEDQLVHVLMEVRSARRAEKEQHMVDDFEAAFADLDLATSIDAGDMDGTWA